MIQGESTVFQVLLIQENVEYAEVVAERLSKEKTSFKVHNRVNLEEGLLFLETQHVDIVLLELSLPDSWGIHAFEQVHRADSRVPIVILATFDQEMLALQAIKEGAQDYILKAEIEGKILPRVIQNAIERHRMRIELQDMTLTDDLTGLLNRRGFLLLAEQQLKLAKRNDKELLLLLGDIDGFKQINDTYGHLQGDVALSRIAEVLRQSLRDSDIIARIGGDEFAIIAVDASRENVELLRKRIQSKLEESQKTSKSPYSLSMSLGAAVFDNKKITFVEQLIGEADQVLYQNKKVKKNS